MDAEIIEKLAAVANDLYALQISPQATVESNLALMHVQQAHEQMRRHAHNRAKSEV